MKWYIAVLKKYAVFSGRARRKEYCNFVLFYLIFAFVLYVLDRTLGTMVLRTDIYPEGFGLLFILYTFAVFLPGLAVVVRRLHDIGKSGWWILITLIPYGSIGFFVLMVIDSQPGENQYGPNPKENVPSSAMGTPKQTVV